MKKETRESTPPHCTLAEWEYVLRKLTAYEQALKLANEQLPEDRRVYVVRNYGSGWWEFREGNPEAGGNK